MDFLGATVQFTAQARDQNGLVVAGVPVVWSSSNPLVASVDQTGRATGLQEGAAQITASVDGVTGAGSLAVSPVPCTTDVDLQPGAFEVFPVDCALALPVGTAGDRYRVAVVNQNISGGASAVTNVTLNVTALPTGTATAGATGGATLTAASVSADREILGPNGGSPLRLTARDRRNLELAAAVERRTRAAHTGLRAAEAALVSALGPDAVPPRAAALAAGTGEPFQVADLPAKLQLRANPGTSCTAEVPRRTALLLGQNDFLAVYQDSIQNADPLTQVTPQQAQQILDYYAAHGKATIDAYFPGVPDIDGNGKILVYVSFDDSLDDGATAAYVWGGDLIDVASCAASNEAELTYFNSAMLRELDNGFDQALETTVHEVKHISSFWHGLARSNRLNASAFHPSWIEEGAAEIAGNMSSRRAWAALGGPAANARITETELRDAPSLGNGQDIPPEVFGVVLRLFRAQAFLTSQPNGVIIEPNGAGPGASIYASGWTFLRWLGDAFGGAASAPSADAAFFRAQNDSLTPAGVTGLEQLTGSTFQNLLEDFAVAAMFHMEASEPATGGYTSYDFPSAVETFCFAVSPAEDPNNSCGNPASGPPGTWPWPVTTSTNAVMWAPFADGAFSGSIGPTGVRIHEFRSDGTGNGIALRATASQPARVIVARVQ
ncbi:MAG: Ig-like domain-containing protein [Longimicrobiales bacterium]|nr:Ig-like domain-containing protein [Longimicrobiales bacterium]